MALTTEQLQSMLDALDEAIASGELEVTTGDGKHVKFDSFEAMERRRKHVLRLMGRRSAPRVSYLRLKEAGS